MYVIHSVGRLSIPWEASGRWTYAHTPPDAKEYSNNKLYTGYTGRITRPTYFYNDHLLTSIYAED